MANQGGGTVEDDAPSGLSSVDNALRVLTLVSERRAIRVAEAAEELNVARSTAHRLLTALRNRGFVDQEKPNSVYRPGGALLDLGLAAIRAVDIRRLARPMLEQLRDQTRETSSLLLLEGNMVRFIDDAESPRSVRVGSRTGLVLPAHCTAGGKSLLAAIPEAELERRYPARPLERRTPASIADWDSLLNELDEVRRRGYAVNKGEGETSISAVGVVIQDLIGYPLAALAVVMPTSRFETEVSVEDFAELARAAAAEIEVALVPDT